MQRLVTIDVTSEGYSVVAEHEGRTFMGVRPTVAAAVLTAFDLRAERLSAPELPHTHAVVVDELDGGFIVARDVAGRGIMPIKVLPRTAALHEIAEAVTAAMMPDATEKKTGPVGLVQ